MTTTSLAQHHGATVDDGGGHAGGGGGGGMASVDFRVRCETLGHGEAVFLVNADHPTRRKGIPLYTTSASYPWYCMRSPVTIALPQTQGDAGTTGASSEQFYTYRYAIYRAGAFHRFEAPSDGPTDAASFHQSSSNRLLRDDDVSMYDEHVPHPGRAQTQTHTLNHSIPLRLLAAGESYVVSDVLGITTGTPDIERVTLQHPGAGRMKSADSLHSSASMLHSGSQHSLGKGKAGGAGSSSSAGGKKKVNFAPTPIPFKPPSPSKATPAVNLTSSDGLVVASVFLPVHLHRSDAGKWTAHWDYESLLSMETHLRVTRVGTVKWRGWHGNFNRGDENKSPEAGVPVSERHLVEECLRPFNCVPVWVDTQLFGEMYNGFCKGVLWSVFHNVTSVYSSSPEGDGANSDSTGGGSGGANHPPSTTDMETDLAATVGGALGAPPLPASDANAQFSDICTDDVALGRVHGDGGREAALWSAYTAVNKQFADVIIQCFNQGDLVWIHGFHLLILPSFLIRRIPMAKIGLFLHTPFPSSEIFRTLWCREDLLRGMLNADQVGFHLFEYARHFLTCARRLLGLTYGMIPDAQGGYNLCIETGGRNVAVTSIHAGVEPPIVRQLLYHSVTTEKAYSIRSQFRGKVIFCAIDRMESLKGIPLKMLGLERFLNRCPQYVGKIVLLQVGISAFERGDDYFKTKREVLAMVEKINRLWPGTVQFQECAEADMRLQQRMALLRSADVCMVTTLRDGLNRIPLEFTMAHLDALTEQGMHDGRKRGICILSEFSSCTRVMRGALHVNPWKISQIANAFHQALDMSEDERRRRITCASEFVTRVTTQRWALAVLLDLKGVQKNIDGHFSTAGLGLGYRILGMDTGFYSLDTSAVAKSFKHARHRLILLDYGGTIISNDNLDNLHRYQMVNRLRLPSLPTEHLIHILEELCGDRRNTVFVVSGKERHSLAKALGHISHLGLAAEHGMFLSWPTSKPERRRWETIIPDQDRSWRSLAITIMEVYTSRTHGSYIEETEMKVLWQYRDADPEFGYIQSRELEDHLSNVLRGYAVEVLHGGMEEGGYVEVRPAGVNKGVLAMNVIRRLPKKIDFALVLGDDHCDEPMLSVMRQIGRRVQDARKAKKGLPPADPLPATVTLVDVSSCDEYVASDLKVFTGTVGKKPSSAANYLNDVDEVHELLEVLTKMSARDHKYYSSGDLRSMEALTRKMPVNTAIPNSENEMLVSGMKRSSSLGKITDQDTWDEANKERLSSPGRVSTSLNQFLGTIEDDDEEEAFFF